MMERKNNPKGTNLPATEKQLGYTDLMTSQKSDLVS